MVAKENNVSCLQTYFVILFKGTVQFCSNLTKQTKQSKGESELSRIFLQYEKHKQNKNACA